MNAAIVHSSVCVVGFYEAIFLELIKCILLLLHARALAYQARSVLKNRDQIFSMQSVEPAD